jgi:AcrR family transcriptional regulator
MWRGFATGIRKRPLQARAQATFDAILDAAAELLTRESAAETTNRIAERAGVSIGTLYQYFADKDAIVAAMVERDLRAMQDEALQAARDGDPDDLEAYLDRLVGRFLDARRRRGRFGLLVSRAMGPAGLEALLDGLAERVRTQVIVPQLRSYGPCPGAVDQASFVAVHGVVGAIRAAERSAPERLAEPSFRAGLVALAMGALTPAMHGGRAERSETAQGSRT